MEERAVILQRYKYIRLSGDMYVRLLTNKMVFDIIANPLPKDTKYIRSGFDSMGNIIMIIESQEFPEIDVMAGEVPFHSDIFFKKLPTNIEGLEKGN